MLEITNETQEDILSEIDIENSDPFRIGEELRALKLRLNVMGPVNLSAPEDDSEFTDRINFLKSELAKV